MRHGGIRKAETLSKYLGPTGRHRLAFLLLLQYSVHPVRGPDMPSNGIYQERFFEQEVWIEGGVSTHRFVWHPEFVRFGSFDGADLKPMVEWQFNGQGSPRRPMSGGQPVQGIPRPGPKTHAQINLWLADMDKDRLGDPPTTGQEVEVVIEKFEFTG